jgi:hypothetical protein
MTSLVLSTVTFAQSTHQIGGCSIESAGEDFPGAANFSPMQGTDPVRPTISVLVNFVRLRASAYYGSHGRVNIIAINNEVK